MGYSVYRQNTWDGQLNEITDTSFGDSLSAYTDEQRKAHVAACHEAYKVDWAHKYPGMEAYLWSGNENGTFYQPIPSDFKIEHKICDFLIQKVKVTKGVQGTKSYTEDKEEVIENVDEISFILKD